MSNATAETVFVVGAGFSHYAGLPLTSKFTEAILEAREFGRGPSRLLVEFVSRFIHDAFDHGAKAGAKYWPDLEDIFTCVDLSANSGHHLGSTFGPADLRTVRRAILSRIMRMLDQKYQAAHKQKGPDWKKLDDFFWRIDSQNVGFISMNWDTVIERKLALTNRGEFLIDYCCDASPASIPNRPDEDDFSSRKAFLKEIQKAQAIKIVALPDDVKKQAKIRPIVKIHGSANWLYCDNCRRLFCFHPEESRRIADQLMRADDLFRIKALLRKKGEDVETIIENLRLQPQVKCVCSEKVPLGTRIATFSYRKALDFPMFQKSWFAAEELLRSANKWVFIGYSLPAADYEFKYLLKRTQLCRPKQPEFIIVSGGSKTDVRRAYQNYRKFLGRTINKFNFFPSGLTQEAVNAICR